MLWLTGSGHHHWCVQQQRRPVTGHPPACLRVPSASQNHTVSADSCPGLLCVLTAVLVCSVYWQLSWSVVCTDSCPALLCVLTAVLVCSVCWQLSWSALCTDLSFPFPVAEFFLLLVTCVSLSTVRCLSPDINYHWRELPQVSFLLRQKFCCNKLTFVMTNTKHVSCHDKSLSWQNYFVVTNIILLQQHTFVETKAMFCLFVTCLSWQNFCRNKNNTCGSSHQW